MPKIRPIFCEKRLGQTLNYIAHIHIASVTNTSLLGNFLGDFIKGAELGHLASSLQNGIKLHRKVDTFTDVHPEIKSFKRTFPSAVRRLASVAIDVYFDHLLLKYYEGMNSNAQNRLFQRFYDELREFELPYNQRYSAVRASLLQHQWLQDYNKPETCLAALFSIERRLGNRIKFAQAAMAHLEENQEQALACFTQFYPELLAYAKNQNVSVIPPTSIN